MMARIVPEFLKLFPGLRLLLPGLLTGIFSTPASAGNSLQFFAGYADTEDSYLASELLYIVPPVSGLDRISGDSASFGLRYLKTEAGLPPLSLGLDLSHYDAWSDAVDIDTWLVTFQLLYSFKGQPIEPYVGMGLSLTYIGMDVSPDSDLGVAVSEDTFGDGLALMMGLSVPIKDRFTLFLEYRYDQTEIDFKTQSFPLFAPSQVTSRYSAELESHRLLLGFSYNF